MTKTVQYFKGDELAASVFLSKYAAEGEETPDQMHRRMAQEFARVDYNYQLQEQSMNIPMEGLSDYAKKRKELTEESIYEYFDKFGYIVPQGSVMSTLGTTTLASLSNCFVVDEPGDSYGHILNTDQELANLYKRRAGVGTGISGLRPEGSKTTNTAKSSTGAVSFMERFSNTTREVAMNGRKL